MNVQYITEHENNTLFILTKLKQSYSLTCRDSKMAVWIVCNAFCGVISGCSLLPVICDRSLGRFASDTGGPGALLFPCCCVGELSLPAVCGVVDGGCDVNRGNADKNIKLTILEIPKEYMEC